MIFTPFNSSLSRSSEIHNIELYPGKGGQLVRSAGNSAQLMAKEGKYATLRLPSGEMRMVPIICRASVIADQRDICRSVRIVLDRENSCRNSVLPSLKVDDPVFSSGTAALIHIHLPEET